MQTNETQCPKAQIECTCPKTDCQNHGTCCKCITHHRKIGKPVNCMAALTENN